MALNGILTSALTTLQTNSAALRVVSQNVANVNTPSYSRRVVDFGTMGSAGEPNGVTIDDIKRVTDQFLTQEALSANSSAAQYNSQSNTFDQINALLGSPGDGNALTTKLSSVFSALGEAALSPSSPSSQNNVFGKLKGLASSISSLSDSLGNIATQIDSQVATAATTANSLIKQIYDFNNLIKFAQLHGDTDTTYLDERDKALSSLSQLMDVRTTNQNDGTILVTTGDGLSLVSDSYAQISYSPSQTGNYNSIIVQDTNPSTGQPIGSAQSLDPHVSGGQIRGLLDMRDGTLAGLRNELGAFAQSVAVAFNREHNASSAYPPPTTMSGRQTGLLAGDALNFTGKTTFALTNSTGVLQHRVDVDFSAGTVSVDGGATTAFTNTIGDFTTKLNTALGTVGGSASFANGQLSLSGGTSGLVVSDTDSVNPSSRAGTAFSQFFGLNDLFTASAPSILKTGMSGTDALGLASNGTINLVVKGPSGQVARTVSVSITAGMTVTQAISALNSSLTGYASVTLNSDGSVTTAMSNSYPGYNVQVTGDTTARGTTGVSVSELFGIGANQMSNQAAGFSLTPAITNNPALLASARPDFSTTQIVGAGDSNGLLALQNLSTSRESVAQAGNLGAQVTTLNDYGAAFYQDIATQSSAATNNKTTQDDRLSEANTRLSNATGVSLDEELSNMVVYQQAYSAGARMLTMVGNLYDTLLKIMG